MRSKKTTRGARVILRGKKTSRKKTVPQEKMVRNK
jgi:hypothetical protein